MPTMRLSVDFSALGLLAAQMGAFENNWEPTVTLEPIDRKIADGMEVTLADLDTFSGLLSVQGRQVLLYIPDQGPRILEILEDGLKGRRFHIANCDTLDEMRQKRRFERYVATNDLSGMFPVHGVDPLRAEHSGKIDLRVCKNCLKALNFDGFAIARQSEKKAIHQNFSIAAFFECYSTFFKHLPKRNSIGDTAGYTRDWPEISANVRIACGFKCDECGIDLAEHKNLLHVHHIDGVKSNNSCSNLRPLCADCHRKQPLHEHLYVSSEDMHVIASLRKAQLPSRGGDWDSVLRLSQRATRDLLTLLRYHAVPVPEVAFQMRDVGAENTALELAWPKHRVGIYNDQASASVAQDAGWQVFNMVEAIRDIDTLKTLLSRDHL